MILTEPCGDLITSADVSEVCDDARFETPPTDEQLADAVAAASYVAWALAGRRVGVCTVTDERPGRINRSNCCVIDPCCSCACKPASTLILGESPVIDVTEVVIGGVALGPGEYRLRGANRLVRVGDERWPPCQLLHLTDDAEDVVRVTYTWGVPIGEFGTRAIAALACEMLTGVLAPARCRLPQRVVSITRQGVSFAVLDPFDFLDEGRTGVYDLDMWLRAINPHGRTRRPRVRTPDVLRG